MRTKRECPECDGAIGFFQPSICIECAKRLKQQVIANASLARRMAYRAPELVSLLPEQKRVLVKALFALRLQGDIKTSELELQIAGELFDLFDDSPKEEQC